MLSVVLPRPARRATEPRTREVALPQLARSLRDFVSASLCPLELALATTTTSTNTTTNTNTVALRRTSTVAGTAEAASGCTWSGTSLAAWLSGRTPSHRAHSLPTASCTSGNLAWSSLFVSQGASSSTSWSGRCSTSRLSGQGKLSAHFEGTGADFSVSVSLLVATVAEVVTLLDEYAIFISPTAVASPAFPKGLPFDAVK